MRHLKAKGECAASNGGRHDLLSCFVMQLAFALAI